MEGSLVVEELPTKICLAGFRFFQKPFGGATLLYIHCRMFVTNLRSDVALLDHLKKNLRNLTTLFHWFATVILINMTTRNKHRYHPESRTNQVGNFTMDTMISLARICRLRIYGVLTWAWACTESVVLAYTHSLMRWWWGQQHAKERDQVSKPSSDPWTWVPMSLWLGNQYQ